MAFFLDAIILRKTPKTGSRKIASRKKNKSQEKKTGLKKKKTNLKTLKCHCFEICFFFGADFWGSVFRRFAKGNPIHKKNQSQRKKTCFSKIVFFLNPIERCTQKKPFSRLDPRLISGLESNQKLSLLRTNSAAIIPSGSQRQVKS